MCIRDRCRILPQLVTLGIQAVSVNLHRGGHSCIKIASVSYTHLDVYKRQALGLMYEQDSPNFPDGDNDTIKDDETSFTVTEFGRKFIDIVG